MRTLSAHIYVVIVAYQEDGSTKSNKVTLYRGGVLSTETAIGLAKDLAGDNGIDSKKIVCEVTSVITFG